MTCEDAVGLSTDHLPLAFALNLTSSSLPPQESAAFAVHTTPPFSPPFSPSSSPSVTVLLTTLPTALLTALLTARCKGGI